MSTVNGDWPRVSTVLRDMGLAKPYPPFIPHIEHARLRGQAVAEAIRLHELGQLDRGPLHPEVGPRFVSYLAFRRLFHPVEVEREVSSAELRVRGTLDAAGYWRDLVPQQSIIVDYKCSDKPDLDAATYQLAAYALLRFPTMPPGTVPTFCVELREEGHRIHDCTSPDAGHIFTAAVRLWWARREGPTRSTLGLTTQAAMSENPDHVSRD